MILVRNMIDKNTRRKILYAGTEVVPITTEEIFEFGKHGIQHNKGKKSIVYDRVLQSLTTLGHRSDFNDFGNEGIYKCVYKIIPKGSIDLRTYKKEFYDSIMDAMKDELDKVEGFKDNLDLKGAPTSLILYYLSKLDS